VSRQRDSTIVLIGVFRLTKAAVLVVMGVGALAGFSRAFGDRLEELADASGLFWARHLAARALAALLSLSTRSVRELGLACLAYAAVFTVEGVGLVRRRRWAEWITVVVTSSFVPLEIYEVAHRPGAGKSVALVLNVLIVVYIAVRIWRRRRARRRRALV
jgi:uncharacterized membrane protein (DUF2068 family)